MKPSEREYVLGTDRADLERLGLQHQLWSEHAARAWERAGFQRGLKLLDVGCGPGFATFDLAQRVGPRGKIVAGILPTLVKMRLITQADERAFCREWAKRSRDPSAFFTSPPMVEIIAVKR